MCYSGLCRWEDYMGDCRFPHDKEVRDKFPLPLCDIPTCKEEKEYLDDKYKEIQKILKMKTIKQIVKPENGIEEAIIADAEFITGAEYGKPRKGHPEGKVIFHIEEVLGNIDEFYGEDEDRENLRVIALIHDTFKHKVDRNQPKTGSNHHAMIARRFAEKFPINSDILLIIEKHDEAYNAWGKGARRGKWYEAEKRANSLIHGLLIENCLDLYVKFYHCDNATGDKGHDDIKWFKSLIE